MSVHALLSRYRYLTRHQIYAIFNVAGLTLGVGAGCIGLYGLASFSTARRIKETVIQKTLGASSHDILRLLVGEFLRPVFIANLAAWPIAYVALRTWQSGFDQRISLNPLYFLSATLLSLIIAFATVAGGASSVASPEPSRALRHE